MLAFTAVLIGFFVFLWLGIVALLFYSQCYFFVLILMFAPLAFSRLFLLLTIKFIMKLSLSPRLSPSAVNGVSNTRLSSLSGLASDKVLDGTQDIEFSIDWLSVSYEIPVSLFKKEIEYMAGWLEDEIDWSVNKPLKIGKWFDESVRTVRGGRVCWNTLDDMVEVHISLTGSVLSSVRMSNLTRALKYMHRYYRNCSRIDIAMDCCSSILDKLRIDARASWEKGLQSGFGAYTRIDSGKTAQALCVTHYWGSRDSPRVIRIYDKVGFARFESELKRDKSTSMYEYLIGELQNGTLSDCIKQMFFASIQGINFYENKKDVNLDRNEIAGFWIDFLCFIEYCPVKLAKVAVSRTLQDAMVWLEKSVSATLAMVKEYMGVAAPDYLMGLYSVGKERMTKLQKMKVRRAKAQVGYA